MQGVGSQMSRLRQLVLERPCVSYLLISFVDLLIRPIGLWLVHLLLYGD